MGELGEFPWLTRQFLRLYPWRRVEPVPWSPMQQPLAASRVALVCSAGFALPDQERFDARVKGGDVSHRWIPADAEVGDLRSHHRSRAFDHAGIEADANLALPIDRLSELVQRGRISEVAPRHLSLMGSITAPGRLVRETAPEMARGLVADQVDVALLVPV